MNTITIIDYGASNLLNVVRAIEHCGASAKVTDKPDDIAAATKLILPGVGAFGDCSNALKTKGLDKAITNYIESDRPFLGICVGMQVMFDRSEEFGSHEGLGIIPGTVKRIPAEGTNGTTHKIPHIGWAVLRKPANTTWDNTLLEPAQKNVSAYFVHSFMGVPENPEHLLADVDYDGISICAAVRKGNAYGCQFHPEKSGEHGLEILSTFLKAA